eukprot:maker-scaffold2471_size15358-snap-gene-0.7 protein:Tk06067 transcript:maker-scaffold2471_size15358-snap-gene-0.7-mRNA-1 annotation:"prolactin regulatory element-binding"
MSSRREGRRPEACSRVYATGAAALGALGLHEIFELLRDGRRTTAESITCYDTRQCVVTNLSVTHDHEDEQVRWMAVGLAGKCHVFKVQMILGGKQQLQGDRASSHPSQPSFKVIPVTSVRTDFNLPEPSQRVCRISPNGLVLATGGDDGFLRLRTFPEMVMAHEIQAHEQAIVDLDFSPDGLRIVTASQDECATLWDARRGTKYGEVSWSPPRGAKYTFKRIRFARFEGRARHCRMFSISNPPASSKLPSFLHRWEGKSGLLERTLDFPAPLSALAVTDNGNFVATGSMFDGTIDIFLAFNLECLKRVTGAHVTCITSLLFLPCDETTDLVRDFSDCSLMSTSVDHQVCIHHVPKQSKDRSYRTISMLTVVFLIAALLICVFIWASYLGEVAGTDVVIPNLAGDGPGHIVDRHLGGSMVPGWRGIFIYQPRWNKSANRITNLAKNQPNGQLPQVLAAGQMMGQAGNETSPLPGGCGYLSV